MRTIRLAIVHHVHAGISDKSEASGAFCVSELHDDTVDELAKFREIFPKTLVSCRIVQAADEELPMRLGIGVGRAAAGSGSGIAVHFLAGSGALRLNVRTVDQVRAVVKCGVGLGWRCVRDEPSKLKKSNIMKQNVKSQCVLPSSNVKEPCLNVK